LADNPALLALASLGREKSKVSFDSPGWFISDLLLLDTGECIPCTRDFFLGVYHAAELSMVIAAVVKQEERHSLLVQSGLIPGLLTEILWLANNPGLFEPIFCHELFCRCSLRIIRNMKAVVMKLFEKTIFTLLKRWQISYSSGLT
jgi:hypothetical protein